MNGGFSNSGMGAGDGGAGAQRFHMDESGGSDASRMAGGPVAGGGAGGGFGPMPGGGGGGFRRQQEEEYQMLMRNQMGNMQAGFSGSGGMGMGMQAGFSGSGGMGMGMQAAGFSGSGGMGMGGGAAIGGGGNMMRRQQDDGTYGNSAATAAMGLGAQQQGMMGGYPGGGMPYDMMATREEAVMGVPYVLPQQEAMMMRGFPYEQQQAGMGMGMPFQGGFDTAGSNFGQQPDGLPQQQQPAMRPGGPDSDDGPLDMKLKQQQEDLQQEKPGNKGAAGVELGGFGEAASRPDAQQTGQKNTVKGFNRRPLSAYNLFFSDERERIIKEREAQGQTEVKIQVQELAKIVGERWKQVPDDMRKHYQDLADEDYKKYLKAKRSNPKDPNQPKRPPTAFLIFSNKRRKQLKAQYPGATNSDLSKMLSKTWQEAPSALRNKYMNEAGELSKKYKTQMMLWRKNLGKRGDDDDDVLGNPVGLQKMSGDDAPQPLSIDAGQPFGWGDGAEDAAPADDPMRPILPALPSKPPAAEAGNLSGKKQKSKDKDPNMPKRPLSAFLAFSNSRRKALKTENPESTNADLSKMLSKQWRELSREERQQFIDEAQEKSEAFKVEMAEWKKNGGTDPDADEEDL